MSQEKIGAQLVVVGLRPSGTFFFGGGGVHSTYAVQEHSILMLGAGNAR